MSTGGDSLLQQAIEQLERRASVTARLRHQIAIGEKQLYGVGGYWQQGNGDDLKVRLELQIAGHESQLLQVSNSRHRWIDCRLPTGRTVTRLDLRQLRADPILSASNLDDIRPGEADWATLRTELIAQTGGLPSMLLALRENFEFMSPQAMRLAVTPPLTTDETNISVFAVVGHWKPERLLALLKTENGQSKFEGIPFDELVQKLPDRFPQEVLLLVGQADRFPYRIEYRKLETPTISAGNGPAIPYQLSVLPMIVLEFSDVVFDAPIDAGQFDYTLTDADFVDQTPALLERLRQEKRSQVASRNGSSAPLAPPTR
jgi:hypothetical protein